MVIFYLFTARGKTTKLTKRRSTQQTKTSKQEPGKKFILSRSVSNNSEDDFEIVSPKRILKDSRLTPKDSKRQKPTQTKQLTTSSAKKKNVIKKSTSQGTDKNSTTETSRKNIAKHRTKLDKVSVSHGKQAKITEMVTRKDSKTKNDQIDEVSVIDSSSDFSSPEAKEVDGFSKSAKTSRDSERSSTEQRKGKSYLGMDFEPVFTPKDDKETSEKPNINIYDYIPSQESPSPDKRRNSSSPKKKNTFIKSPHRRVGLFQRYQNKLGTKLGSPAHKRHSTGSSVNSDKIKNLFGTANLKGTAKRNLKIPNLSQFQRAIGQSASTSSSSALNATITKPNTDVIEIGSSSSDHEKSLDDLVNRPVTATYSAKRKVNSAQKVEKCKRSKLSSGKSPINVERKSSKQKRASGIGENITSWESSDAEEGPVTPSTNMTSNERAKEKNSTSSPLGSDSVIILSDSDNKESEGGKGSRNKIPPGGGNRVIKDPISSSVQKTDKHSSKSNTMSESTNNGRNVFENLFGNSNSSPSIHSQQSAFRDKRHDSVLSVCSSSEVEQTVVSTDITSDRPSSPVFGNRASDFLKSKLSKVAEMNANGTKANTDQDQTIPECPNEDESKRSNEGRSGSSTPVYKDRASVFDQLNTEFLKIKSASSACSGDDSQDIVNPSDTQFTTSKSSITNKAKLVTNKKLFKSPTLKRKMKTHFGMRKPKGRITSSTSGTDSDSVGRKPTKKIKTSSEIDRKRESTRKRSLISKYEECVGERQERQKQSPPKEYVSNIQDKVETRETVAVMQHHPPYQTSEVPQPQPRHVNDDHSFFSESPSGLSDRKPKVERETVGKFFMKSVKRKLAKKVSRANTSTESESDLRIVKPPKRPKKRTSVDLSGSREKLGRKRAVPRRYSEFVPSSDHLEDLFEKEAEHLSQTAEVLREVTTGCVLSRQTSAVTSTGDSCTSGAESSIKESSESDLDTPLNVIAADKLKASQGLAPHGPLGTPPRMLDSDDSDDEGMYRIPFIER